MVTNVIISQIGNSNTPVTANARAYIRDFDNFFKQMETRQREAVSTIMNLAATNIARDALLRCIETKSSLAIGVVNGALGNTETAGACAKDCKSPYEKGMIAAACGNTQDAKIYLATIAKFLKNNGATLVTEKMVEGAGNYIKPEGNITAATMKIFHEKGSVLAAFLASIDPETGALWADYLQKSGYPHRAALLWAECGNKEYAEKFASAAIAETDKTKINSEVYMISGIVFAKIGERKSALSCADKIRAKPEIYNCIMANMDGPELKARAWERGMALLESGKHPEYAFDIFASLEDAPRAVNAAMKLADENLSYSETALLEAAMLCRKKEAELREKFKRIDNGVYDAIVLSLSNRDDELTGILISADARRFEDARKKLAKSTVFSG